MIFIQIRSVVLGIHHLESRLYYELFYYAQSYAPLLSLFIMSHPFVMHSIIHMFNTSVIPYTSLDQYLTPNLNTIPNIQNMRFFCCSVYVVARSMSQFKVFGFILKVGVCCISPEPFESFSLNFTKMFLSVRRCAEEMTQLPRL